MLHESMNHPMHFKVIDDAGGHPEIDEKAERQVCNGYLRTWVHCKTTCTPSADFVRVPPVQHCRFQKPGGDQRKKHQEATVKIS